MATSDRSITESSQSPEPLHNVFGHRQPIATVSGGLVKCKENGDLDWNTLGKVLTASVLGEAFCVSYADFKYGRMTRGSRVDIDWKFSYEEKGVLVFKKDATFNDESSSQNIISFAGRGVLNYPLQHVAAAVSNPDNFKVWNKFLVQSRVLKVLSETEKSKDMICHFCHENSQCLVRAKRDFLLYIRATQMEDGNFVQSAISISHPICPLVEGTTRAECCLGSGWMLEPYEGNSSKTLATYIANIDVCTPLPPSMTSKMLRQQPLTIHHLKKFLKSSYRIQRSLSVHQDSKTANGIEESEFETSLTSTIHGVAVINSTHLFADNPSNFYFEPMGVDHFMGAHKTPDKKQDAYIEDEENVGYASFRTTKSDGQNSYTPGT